MKMKNISTIGRPVDFSYPTNRAIAILTLVIMVAAALYQGITGMPWSESFLWGLQAGLAVFLAWAMGREVDPDMALAAFVSAGLTLIGLFVRGLPNLALLFWSLLALRVVNRTTGLPASLLDSLGLLGLGTWQTFGGNPGYGALTALAFLIDGWLDPENRRQWIFAALALIATTIALVTGASTWPGDGFSWLALGIALGLSLLFLPVISRTPPVTSRCDRTDERVNSLRVQVGQVLAGLAGIEMALWGGMMGLLEAYALWAVIVGVILYRLFRILAQKSSA
jgi:hypothetical protein